MKSSKEMFEEMREKENQLSVTKPCIGVYNTVLGQSCKHYPRGNYNTIIGNNSGSAVGEQSGLTIIGDNIENGLDTDDETIIKIGNLRIGRKLFGENIEVPYLIVKYLQEHVASFNNIATKRIEKENEI